jgi:hypothetical protein
MHRMWSRLALPLCLAGLLSLAGCDMLGIESATQVAEKRDAEGKAIGGACRHAGRAIEDCYALNRKADKAAVFAGWRDMNDYMRENQIEAVPPQLSPPTASTEVAKAPEEKKDKGGKGEKADKPEKAGKGEKADKAEGKKTESS